MSESIHLIACVCLPRCREWYLNGNYLVVIVSVAVILPLALMKQLGKCVIDHYKFSFSIMESLKGDKIILFMTAIYILVRYSAPTSNIHSFISLQIFLKHLIFKKKAKVKINSERMGNDKLRALEYD